MGLSRNIPLFIAFRVLFNARFYYPILGILFLDLGLTLEQYSLLNACWAVAIVTLEIPSGALADVIGRKRMVLLAAIFMVVEISLLAFAPTGQPGLLFALLLVNRILGGAAEASASGADEALAYDSLPDEHRDLAWPRVLESLMRWQSGAFFFAMIVGSLVYDPVFLHKAAGLAGIDWNPLARDVAHWPVYLTLVTSVLCLGVATAMREPGPPRQEHAHPFREAWLTIKEGARTVFTVRRILLVMLMALACDSSARLFVTFQSNYFRLIEIPTYLFGLIGSLISLLGFIAAPICRRLVTTRSAPANFAAVAAMILMGLAGATLGTPLFGVWIVVPLGLAMTFLAFFTSHYLNLWALPELRATVLSFRGVALNLGYGAAGVLFAGLTSHLRAGKPGDSESVIFGHSLLWLPPAFLVVIVIVGAFALASRSKCQPAIP